MDIKEFINKVCQEIKYEPVRKGISEELTSHIQDIKEEYINKGIQEKEAEEKAVAQMGIAEDIGRNCLCQKYPDNEELLPLHLRTFLSEDIWPLHLPGRHLMR